MTTIKYARIDGKGSCEIELRRANGEYRWFERKTGTETDVCGKTRAEAIDTADLAWSGPTWNLEFRTRYGWQKYNEIDFT